MTSTDPLAGANAGQAEFWTTGPGLKWAAHHARLDALFATITTELLDRAAIAPGEDVLDIGCGAGDSTLAAADRAGPGGRVTGLDISETLLDVARQRAAGRPEIRFVLADAQTHAFAPARHDLLLSRFGLMFFADPVAGFRNLAQALKPGGRAVFVTWARMEANPWNRDAKAVGVARLGPVPADDPRAPGQFAFAEIGYVTDILARAGFRDITGEETPSNLHVAGRAEDAAELATGIGPVSRILRENGGTEADRAAIATDLADLFRAYEGPDGVRVPALLNHFSARRP